jgi:hypothetical protein
MKNFFTQNIGWKLLSLAAAVLLWISVASEPELATFVSAHVEYKNLSPGVEINSDVVETVYLEVRGPSEALRLPEVAAALRGDPGYGRHRAWATHLHHRQRQCPAAARRPTVRAIPAQIRMDFEPGATRSVPVEVRLRTVCRRICKWSRRSRSLPRWPSPVRPAAWRAWRRCTPTRSR